MNDNRSLVEAGTQLPDGWVDTSLSEVAESVLGKMLDKRKNKGERRPYLRNVNVQWGRFELGDIKEMRIEEAELDRYKLRAGDLVVCEGGEPGRCAVWAGQREIYFQKALHRVRPCRAVSAHYLAYYLRYVAETGALDHLFTGSTIKHLPGAKLKTLRVPIPPTPEQDRIVEAIESAMAAVDEAEGDVRRAASQAAALGELVAERAAEATGVRRPLGELLREPLRNGHSAKASEDGSGIRTLTLTAVTNKSFIAENTKMTTADASRVDRLWLEPGDILVQRSNTPELVGSAALYDGPTQWAIYPDLLIRVRPNDEVEPDFLLRFLQAPSTRRQLRAQAQGIAGSMPKISQDTLEKLQVAVPSRDDQRRVVNEIETLHDAVRGSLHEAEQCQALASDLRRSILHRAFTGRLVQQDPNDETASELLERIKAEKAQREAEMKAARSKKRKRGATAKRSKANASAAGGERS